MSLRMIRDYLIPSGNEAYAPGMGYFHRRHPRMAGIRYGNWGSRPYEYRWVEKNSSVAGKRIIDIGTGIPSQYDWFRYVQKKMKPSYYFGIDPDSRMLNEEVHEDDLDLACMSMTEIKAESESFDFAYCISVLEHVRAEVLQEGFREIHRVLKPGATFLITLDEIWDIDGPDVDWNILERDMIQSGRFVRSGRSFSLKEFLPLIGAYFKPDSSIPVPEKTNADSGLLHHKGVNSCVSYAVLKRV